MKREYFRTTPERVAELEADGWRVVVRHPFSEGHAECVLLMREIAAPPEATSVVGV